MMSSRSRAARWASAEIGHTGTLDPLATGVLPLVVGRATRLASLLSGVDKEYLARIRFGTTTSTYDGEGDTADLRRRRCHQRRPSPRRCPEFRGTYSQMPPPFSAKKVGGTPAYKLARQQKPVELKPVHVTVSALDLRRYTDGVAELRLVCSSGFYVRSLAHDLGQRLGCGAHLESLRRTRAGAFEDADAVPLDTIVREGPATASRVIPIDRLLTGTAVRGPERPGREARQPRQRDRAAGPGIRRLGQARLRPTGFGGQAPIAAPGPPRRPPRHRRATSMAGFCIP